MENELTQRRERRLQTTPNNFRVVSKQLLLGFQNIIEEEKEVENNSILTTTSIKQHITKTNALEKYTTSTSLLKQEIESQANPNLILNNANLETMYSNASTKEAFDSHEIKRRSLQTRIPTKKQLKTNNKINSSILPVALVFLDFNELKQKMDRINKNISDDNFRLAERMKLENIYRDSLISLIREIDKKIEAKEQNQTEITLLQKKITQSKMKIDEIFANFKIFQQAAQKQNSTAMFSRFCAEKERVTKLINSIKLKQDSYKNSLNDKKEYEYELSLKLKELKSLKVKNCNALAEYYNKLLEEANDLRNEGITWILYKLLELGWNLEKCHFPSFINKRQVQFLINYSKKKIELSQLKIIYDAIKKKYSIHPNRQLINHSTIKINTSIGKNQSIAIQKFFSAYYNNKNSSAYIGLSASEKGDLKIRDFLKDLDSGDMTERNDNDNIQKHLCIIIDRETVENIAEIKNQIDKVKKEVTSLIDSEIKAYQSENDDIKILNFAQYERIYQVLFGKYILTLSN